MATETVTPETNFVFEAYSHKNPAVDRVLIPGRAVQPLLEKVQDIAAGAVTTLELIEWSDSMPNHGGDALLNDFHKANMIRMLISSLGMIVSEVENMRTFYYDQYTPEGVAERSKNSD